MKHSNGIIRANSSNATPRRLDRSIPESALTGCRIMAFWSFPGVRVRATDLGGAVVDQTASSSATTAVSQRDQPIAFLPKTSPFTLKRSPLIP
jgi:hypothetical protein